MSREQIVQEILDERKRQEIVCNFDWKHDAELTSNDWVALLTRHAGLAVEDSASTDRTRWRKQMIRVAAVALAALEADNKAGEIWRPLIEVGQRQANYYNEPVLVIPYKIGMEYVGNIPYCVLLSSADEGEIKRSVYKVEPTKEKA